MIGARARAATVKITPRDEEDRAMASLWVERT